MAELQDVLLMDAYFCEDLLLDDPPARPPDFKAPPAGQYEPPLDMVYLRSRAPIPPAARWWSRG